MKPFRMEQHTRIDKNEELNPFSIEQKKFLQAKYEDMLGDALDEEDFRGRDGYSDAFIDKCIAEMQDIDKYYLQQNRISQLKGIVYGNERLSPEYREISKFMEALFYNKLGGKDGWIPNAMVWKTSKWDDMTNSIDFITETENGEFSLGTDVTFSSERGLIDKLDKIKGQIEKGKLPEAKFYESASGRKGPIPRVIIAIERDKLIQGLKLWADGQGDLLDKHPIKVKTELMIEAQLEAFATYAKAINKRDIAAECNNLLAHMQRSIATHRETEVKKYENQLSQDQAYQTVILWCDKLKREAAMITKEKLNSD